MNERTAGVSSISPWKSVYYMIKVTLAIVIYRIAGKNGGKQIMTTIFRIILLIGVLLYLAIILVLMRKGRMSLNIH